MQIILVRCNPSLPIIFTHTQILFKFYYTQRNNLHRQFLPVQFSINKPKTENNILKPANYFTLLSRKKIGKPTYEPRLTVFLRVFLSLSKSILSWAATANISQIPYIWKTAHYILMKLCYII